MIESFQDLIIKNTSEQLYQILKTYEDTYKPDIGLARPDGSQIFDFKVQGGDIKMFGFYHQSTLSTILARAIQDFLLRLFISPESSIFNSGYGNGLLSEPLSALNNEVVEGLIRSVLTECPYIGEIRFIRTYSPNVGELNVDFSAKTITNNELSFKEVITYG